MHDPWLSLLIGLALGIIIGVTGTLWFFWVLGYTRDGSTPDD